ncbi:MAG: methionine--tRNA ligase subunit beta [Candidatus Omnitrophica bacterium]|nr:methionine--tRNA ligase subunit beta [Candidatus Omnitrophota bacterium]
MIGIEEFKKVRLVIARVASVEDIPGADKLYKLTIDAGQGEMRTIVAGIKRFYGANELEGRLIVLLENLTPAVIRGVESHGMLLAASTSEGALSLLTPDKDIAPGSVIA